MTAYVFGPFKLTRQELKREGQSVRIDPQPLAVLRFLITQRPAIVSMKELLVGAWPGTRVEPGTMHKAISRLRSSLGDTTLPPQFVETIPKRGYRFIANITEVVEIDAPERARSAYTPGDRSRFVRDVTIPDGTIVRVGQRFSKKWEIKNVGVVPWIGRFLARLGPASAPGRLTSAEKARISATQPGESCIVEVELVAPRYPGSCYAEWKMVDELGRLSLPRQKGVYVSVDVRE